MPKANRPTQVDVARRAGVSQAVVSYVVNDTESGRSLPEATRAKVWEAVDDLGYVPNETARRLRTQRTNTIAGVVPDITNPFYPELQRGIQDALGEHGYDLITYNTDGTHEGELRFLRAMTQGRADGVIGAFFNVGASDLAPLVDHGVAIVRLDHRPTPHIPLDNIFVDNVAASRAITRHLIERGHERIGVLTSDEGPALIREIGFREALADAGLRSKQEWTGSGSPDAAGGAVAMHSILRTGDLPTAVFATNDSMALGAMTVLRHARIGIPRDMALCGFDNIDVAELVDPPLSTIAVHQRAIGRRAAEMILARLDGTVVGGGQSVELPFELVERASTVGSDPAT